MSATPTNASPASLPSGAATWIGWIVGLAALGAVVFGVVHLSEERQLVALVVRTRRRVFRSRPGRVLMITTGAVAVLACALPYLPGSGLLGFVPLPPALMAAVVGIAVLYVTATELAKGRLYRALAPRAP